ncbi:conserved hypothetical protein [Culex quinquefasciatus]|uniref:Uncharacterized protein n=1 Tax=Culex quinquefasciatus TaxID=7176 RepID=B0WRN1_CULQU|nr:conserved hypothetical protein [Culex quinquefasciatus]|eukprot:XP_001851365.1 conserved hypothetical protein [Culex quinquefasciatus]
MAASFLSDPVARFTPLAMIPAKSPPTEEYPHASRARFTSDELAMMDNLIVATVRYELVHLGANSVVTTSSTNEVPSQPLEEESASTAPADGTEGRKRRRLGRKRKRRPLHDDYWQGNPRDEESELHYHDPQQQQQQEFPERKRPYQRWEGSGGGFRPRPDRWSNPYSDAIDPSDSPPQRRPYESTVNTRGRENFQPILDGNRQRRLPPKQPAVEESTASTPGTGYKAYRKPYSLAKRTEEEGGGSSGETTGKGTAADLKALLKQSGGLSLSEILQQRNISLQDLIKGKQMALAALTQSPLDLTTITEPENEVTSVIPTLSSVRFRVYDDSTKRPDFQEVKTIKRIPVYSPSAAPMIGTEYPTTASTTTTSTTELPPSAQDETNSVEDIITLENLGNRNDNVAIFPTVEIKQLALNPVLPTVKEERLRPIKGVASRIRPDLSNSNIRTEETIKRRPELPSRAYATAEQWHSSTPATPTTTTSTREKWTPSPGLNEKREQFLQKLNQSKMRGRPSTTASTEGTNAEENTESLALSDTEPPIQASSERSLMRVPTPRVRIAIKPKQRQTPSPPPSPPSATATTADAEIHEENVTKLLETEPELNIIEKFTSFADVKSVSGEPLYEVHESANEEEDDLIERINQNTQRSFTDSLEEYIRDVTESNPSLFNDLTPIGLSEDRRDILELMEDRRIGARLAKVLSQRNMSLEELLEHRKRGSSQLHLSEMITNKGKPMEDKMDIVTAFEHFPRFNIGNLRSIKPDDIKLDSQGFSYFTSIINIRPTDETHKEGRSMQDKQHKVLDWKLSHGTHQKLDHFLGNGGSKGGLITPSRMSADAEFDSGNDQSSSDLLDLELTGHGFNHRHTVTIESTTMPLGVKSAILASSCIVGVSLAIFAVIFIVCRWRQRRRNKLNYTENFNMAKGRLPMHHQEGGMKTPLNDQHQQMVYTTGQHQLQRERKDSKVNTMDPNSAEVHDYLWDTMRKPFQ